MADVLDSLRFSWLYEPMTFVFERDEAGNCTYGFTPDFYLPRQDLYIEVTEMRIMTPKNGKLRMLRTHYPDVRCAATTMSPERECLVPKIVDGISERTYESTPSGQGSWNVLVKNDESFARY